MDVPPRGASLVVGSGEECLFLLAYYSVAVIIIDFIYTCLYLNECFQLLDVTC